MVVLEIAVLDEAACPAPDYVQVLRLVAVKRKACNKRQFVKKKAADAGEQPARFTRARDGRARLQANYRARF